MTTVQRLGFGKSRLTHTIVIAGQLVLVLAMTEGPDFENPIRISPDENSKSSLRDPNQRSMRVLVKGIERMALFGSGQGTAAKPGQLEARLA
jgi:hypothetical protein